MPCTFTVLRWVFLVIVTTPLIVGCATPAVVLLAAAPGVGTVGYAALPGELEVEYRNSRPVANQERLTGVQSVITTEPNTYEAIRDERLFRATALADASVPHPRTDEEAAAVARSHQADVFVRATFAPAATLASSGFMGLQETLGEYEVSIVTTDGSVIYAQTVVLSKKASTLNNTRFSQSEIREHLVGAFVHNLKTHGFEVAAQ